MRGSVDVIDECLVKMLKSAFPLALLVVSNVDEKHGADDASEVDSQLVPRLVDQVAVHVIVLNAKDTCCQTFVLGTLVVDVNAHPCARKEQHITSLRANLVVKQNQERSEQEELQVALVGPAPTHAVIFVVLEAREQVAYHE